MTDTTAPRAKTPWHFWIVAILALLWNGYGAYDMYMSMTSAETYWPANGFTPEMIAYFNAMPQWMYGPWVLGVGGAALGSLALLFRMKAAAFFFFLSLIGAVVALGYRLMNPMPPLPPALAPMQYAPWIIAAVALFLWWYANGMKKRGVLR